MGRFNPLERYGVIDLFDKDMPKKYQFQKGKALFASLQASVGIKRFTGCKNKRWKGKGVIFQEINRLSRLAPLFAQKC
jgi:hypothetical protein